jgi:hypothetical protein
MQDLHRATGSRVIVKVKDQDVSLSGFTFEDIGTLQGEILRRKRRAKLEVAALSREFLPPEQWAVTWKAAQEEAAKIGFIDEEELDNFLQHSEGIVTFFWILLERQYPGQFTRADVLKTLAEQKVTGEGVSTLLEAFTTLRQQGNSTSQDATQAAP